MPLIHIDVLQTWSEADLTRLLDAVHAAMVQAFEVPDTDRYQVLTQHPHHEMVLHDTGLGMNRTDRVVVLRFISRTRSDVAKTRLYDLLAKNLWDACQLAGDDIIVSIVENQAADWSFGRGKAQFLTGDL